MWVKQQRSARGQSVTVLMVVLTMLVVAPLGFFSAEVARFYLAKQQLRAVLQGWRISRCLRERESERRSRFSPRGS